MSQVTATIEIDAPPERVFAKVMNPACLSEWVTIHRSVEVKSPDPSRQGARMDQKLSLRGVTFTVQWTLDSVSSPTEAVWKGKGPAGSRALIRYRVSGPDSGPTQFEYTNEFSTPGGPLGNRASKMLVGGVSEREAQLSLQQLKSVMES